MGVLLGTEARFRYTEEGTYVSLVPDTDFMQEVLGSCDVGWQEGCRKVVEARAWGTFQHPAYGFDIAAREAEATGPGAGTS